MFNQTPKKIIQTNQLPFLIGVMGLVLLIVFFMYKTQANQKVDIAPSKPKQSLDVSSKTEDSSWFNDDKFKNLSLNTIASTLHRTGQEIESRVISSRQAALKKAEMEDEYATQLEIKKIEDKNIIEEKKMELEAMRAPLALYAPAPPGTPGGSSRPQAAFQGLSQVLGVGNELGKGGISNSISELMNVAQSLATMKFPSMPAISGVSDLNQQDQKQAFLNKGHQDDDYLENTKTKPRSPYEVKAGTYIPAALITGINSDLPGNVNAQVTDNVYDSVTGNFLLIPQGAKLVGEYNSNLSYGQNRVQVVWNRIIFPDGQSIDLEKMQGSDSGGYTGFHDRLDNHYLRIYGNAVLLSLMGAGYDILNQKAEQDTDPRETVAAAVGQKLADVSGQTLQKNMDVQPTVIINPGYKFRIFVMKDMVLERLFDAEGTLSYTE